MIKVFWMGVNFQIGQCRMYVDTDSTRKYYETLPTISDNCKCEDCAYFESNVTRKNIRLFKILKDMGVDLIRQPNINPDCVCSIGETEMYKRSYMGYYQVFGQLSKTKVTQLVGETETVDFYEITDNTSIRYKIKRDNGDKLTFDFYLECDRKQ